jgi:hypothetical protein
MYDVHLTCSREQLLPMVQAFSDQFREQEDVSILDYGPCQKSSNTCYIVLEWSDEVEEAFMKQLKAEDNVLDYSLYSVPSSTDAWPFGVELSRESGRDL